MEDGVINKIPSGFRCDDSLNELYPTIERKVLPYLKNRSSRISKMIPGIDYEDALQEGKIAILIALTKFDFNKSKGMLEAYVGKVVKNAYYGLTYEALTKSKVPYVGGFDADGNPIKRPCFPISLDAMLASEDGERKAWEPPDTKTIGPEMEVSWDQIKDDVGRFTMKMYNKLEGVELEVFRCKVHPSAEFLDALYMDGLDFVYRDDTGQLVLDDGLKISNLHIANFLGIDKNAVDWALYKVRKLFMEMARYDEEFSELFEGLIEDKRWPMIHISREPYEDISFKREVFKRRQLDSKQTAPMQYVEGGPIGEDGKPTYHRLIKWYAWGATIALRKGGEYVTLVVEGRFNPRTGVVFGASGKQEPIPVKWYRSMVLELRDV